MPPKSDEPKVERVTKQERLLTLLSQADGASIEERNLPVSGRARVRVMVRKLPLFGELGTRRRFSKQYYAARQKSLLDAGVIWSGRWASIVLALPEADGPFVDCEHCREVSLSHSCKGPRRAQLPTRDEVAASIGHRRPFILHLRIIAR